MYTKLGYPNNVDAPLDLKHLFEKACEQERFPNFTLTDPFVEVSELKQMTDAELQMLRKDFTTSSDQDSSKSIFEMGISSRAAYMMAMIDDEMRIRHKARVPVKPVELKDYLKPTPLKTDIPKPPKLVIIKRTVMETGDEEV